MYSKSCVEGKSQCHHSVLDPVHPQATQTQFSIQLGVDGWEAFPDFWSTSIPDDKLRTKMLVGSTVLVTTATVHQNLPSLCLVYYLFWISITLTYLLFSQYDIIKVTNQYAVLSPTQIVQIPLEDILEKDRKLNRALGENCMCMLLSVPHECKLSPILFPDWDRKYIKQINLPW